MDISYNELKSKEIVNLCDGAKMGRIIDVIFNSDSGRVSGLVAPGEKHLFKKNEDVFIPLEKVRRIGDDVILVRCELSDGYYSKYVKGNTKKEESKKLQSIKNGDLSESFIRFHKLDNKKYK